MTMKVVGFVTEKSIIEHICSELSGYNFMDYF